jgi:hypothetical protein
MEKMAFRERGVNAPTGFETLAYVVQPITRRLEWSHGLEGVAASLATRLLGLSVQ